MASTDHSEGDCGGPYTIAKRYGKLLCSIWMIGDIIMQALITKKYYVLSQVRLPKLLYKQSSTLW